MRARGWLGAGLLTAALAGAGPAAAFLNDAEARKAITDLREKVTQMEEAAARREAEASAAAAAERTRLAEDVATLRRSLLELNNQIVALRGEIARLGGANETLARELAEAQRRQRDLGQAFDDRLKKIEPVKVAIDGREFMVEQEERRAYEEAFAAIRGGDFDRSVQLFTGFLRRYPGSPYADTARFWLANAQYGRRDYKQAIELFRAFVAAAPLHPRAPDALLALANSQAEMKDGRAARRTIDELLKEYPSSEAAQAGRDRLASLPR
jgi:tol-pal system protein YbgF